MQWITIITKGIIIVLSSIAWREVRNKWQKEMEERLKLGMLNEIAALECESSCTVLGRKRDRYDVELRGGTAAFQIEVGRWKGVAGEERVCKECNSGEVEDVCHWMLCCHPWDIVRQPLVEDWTYSGPLYCPKPYQSNVLCQIWLVM